MPPFFFEICYYIDRKIIFMPSGTGSSKIDKSDAVSILRPEYFTDIEFIPSAILMVILPAMMLSDS